MEKIESLRPYDRLLSEYNAFCEKKKALVERCIDLVVNTEFAEFVVGLDEREPEELGLRFRKAELEISAVSPPGSTTYVTVHYQQQRVLIATHTYESIELDDGGLECYEFVEIERFIPGNWER